VYLHFFFNTIPDMQWRRTQSPIFSYIRPWYSSVTEQNLTGVFGYDNFDFNSMRNFLEQTGQTQNPSIQLIKFNLNGFYSKFSSHHIRFIILLDYLRTHSNELDYVILTDVSDIKFNANPFPFMKEQSSKYTIFVGSEILPDSKYPGTWLQGRWQDCYIQGISYPFPQPWDMSLTFYNCGILGGQVEYVMAFLQLMKHEFLTRIRPDKTAYTYCDMPIFNYVLHFLWHNNSILTGPPFHTIFKTYSKNAIIAHK